ncbi:MAG: ribosome biogenesis GTP-binding protein YihA/YsxC [Terriglobales bacterium]
MRIFARFLLSASDVGHFPSPSLPEVAFLGRSNVGKSSLINTLVGGKLARTSSTPGRTRSINFFEIRHAGQPRAELIFTDLPGYGYAKISREISQEWAQFVDPYLEQRPTLALCIALIDGNVPPQVSDRQLLDFLSANQKPHLIVATKSDRMSGNELSQTMRKLRHEYPSAPLIAFSAKTGSGKEELWKQIRESTEKFAHSKDFS